MHACCAVQYSSSSLSSGLMGVAGTGSVSGRSAASGLGGVWLRRACTVPLLFSALHASPARRRAVLLRTLHTAQTPQGGTGGREGAIQACGIYSYAYFCDTLPGQTSETTAKTGRSASQLLDHTLHAYITSRGRKVWRSSSCNVSVRKRRRVG
ncbi:hypothetical protein L227DRAFT_357638 [Lentinus tigrinus ALCF2SS1-6]|uniref:Uncharacterized protein n=1 Tax=Lentinus tigrinus ALCF2SS1-6 TaxID=1328759 RepID=A0A5C2SJ21_9APHY|nr:hypothetical protein L227DRAFT_357638 [Lentinus tigrinus ALCF2SS1-6]